MRVKIGKYINRWTTSSFEQWWLEKRSGEPFPVNYKETKLDKFVEKSCDLWQTVLNYTINQYLDNKKRDIQIHIDKWDTWGMDHTLSLIIVPMLKQLKATKHGSALTDDEDVPKNLRSAVAPDPEDDYCDLNIHERWNWIMEEMIWTFEEQLNDEFITDKEKRESRDKRIENGMRLFAKYYRGLWD